jgi:signal transduction histidine kinase
MPLLTQRLNTTLEKLRAPQKTEQVTKSLSGSLLQWWNQLQHRYTEGHLQFSIDINKDIEIPVDVFTTVIENLLDNARSKRSREPELKIVVRLANNNGQLCLSVCDTGSAIDSQIAEQLFKEVVSSHDGYGIGLYQCYELASNHGYELSVKDNIDGRVCFALKQLTPQITGG